METSKVRLNVVMGLQYAVIYKDWPVSPTQLEVQPRRKGPSVLHSSVPVFLCLLSSSSASWQTPPPFSPQQQQQQQQLSSVLCERLEAD